MAQTRSAEKQQRLRELLARPDPERLREYRFRFSQSAVFGLPVVALNWFGHALGGTEAERWVGLFQALLAGWVMYVGAAGMLLEGLILRSLRFAADALVAAAAIGLYLYSLISVLHIVIDGGLWYEPLLFHWSVMLIALWTGSQWWRLARRG